MINNLLSGLIVVVVVLSGRLLQILSEKVFIVFIELNTDLEKLIPGFQNQ